MGYGSAFLQLLTYGKPRKSHSSTFTLFYRTFLELLGQLFAWLTNMKRNPLPGYRHLLMPSLRMRTEGNKLWGLGVLLFYAPSHSHLPRARASPSGGSGNASCARARSFCHLRLRCRRRPHRRRHSSQRTCPRSSSFARSLTGVGLSGDIATLLTDSLIYDV